MASSTSPIMKGTFAPIEGDEIESVLDIIEDNGGAGTWEDGAMEEIERWEFPRFDGASDKADMYLSRTGLGQYDTDVETVCAWLEAPRNVVGAVLLLGNPGTGKTALIEAAVTHSERELTTILCTPDHTKDSLFLRFVGEGKGDLLHEGLKKSDDGYGERGPYALGPVPYAAKHGHVLYMDEFMLLVDGVKPVFYSLADGRRFLPEGNVDGSALEVHPDFRLILSSNPMVRGASLPEPVASRCASTTITVETSGSMLIDLGIDEAIVAAWGALHSAGLWHPEVRELRLADYWMGIDPAQAVSAMVPEHCPESQREDVRDIVVSFLGGNIRKDGRLVVR
jgi:hypothetical protein